MTTIRQATHADLSLIRDIAIPTWKVTYADILSEKQMSYMLEKMYSDESLLQQMQEHHVFFIASVDDRPSGFVSINPKTAECIVLEKIYVLPEAQGSGAGKILVQTAETYVHDQFPDAAYIELNVNRDNLAVGFYEKMGFQINRTVDEYIGEGFYKNDYIMRKETRIND